MKRPLKIVLSLISAVAAVVCVLCILFLVQYFRGQALNERLSSSVLTGIITNPMADPEDETRYMQIDVDFNELQAMNPDIYAWVEVPGTVINYPVLQDAEDDLFYINHNADRSYYTGGSIFSQRYNTTTFQDSVTVLYGHNSRSQAMFAQVNNFADAAYFDANRYIYIYTPDTVYQYEIFAAYPHVSDHLLLCNDFDDLEEFDAYFAGLTDSPNANYRRELFPSYGDKVLTLSTCYRQNRMQRFLLQGVLTEEYTVLKSEDAHG